MINVEEFKNKINRLIDDLSNEPNFSLIHEMIRRYAQESLNPNQLYYQTDFIKGYLCCASDHFVDDKTSLRLNAYIEEIEQLRNDFLKNLKMQSDIKSKKSPKEIILKENLITTKAVNIAIVLNVLGIIGLTFNILISGILNTDSFTKLIDFILYQENGYLIVDSIIAILCTHKKLIGKNFLTLLFNLSSFGISMYSLYIIL